MTTADLHQDRRDGPRVGFFGILGSGNLGNDGSLDMMVRYLRDRHPGAELDFFCMGPGQVSARYGAPATSLQWFEAHAGDATGRRADLLKVVGKLADPVRTLRWLRRQDVVIVPGMGVLETTLPLRPWAMPYSLFWLCALARPRGVRVALVSVGANVIRQRTTRRLVTAAARRAHYRSYRDEASRRAVAAMGVDVSADRVYPDLAFALPRPDGSPADDRGAVGVGVMDYHGSNDDRARADEIHRAYLDTVTGFVGRLVDRGRPVRLFTGDPVDQAAVAEVVAGVRAGRPDLDPALLVAEPSTDLVDLMRQMAGVRTVVATRYHNVLCALRMAKPTLSLGYAHKHDALMESMGLGEFRLSAREPDLALLVGRFEALEARADAVTRELEARNAENLRRLDRMFTDLSAALFTDGGPRPAVVAGGHADTGGLG